VDGMTRLLFKLPFMQAIAQGQMVAAEE
jgi:hypothetical protein